VTARSRSRLPGRWGNRDTRAPGYRSRRAAAGHSGSSRIRDTAPRPRPGTRARAPFPRRGRPHARSPPPRDAADRPSPRSAGTTRERIARRSAPSPSRQWRTSSRHPRRPGNATCLLLHQKECSSAIARVEALRASALHEIGKTTWPSCSPGRVRELGAAGLPRRRQPEALRNSRDGHGYYEPPPSWLKGDDGFRPTLPPSPGSLLRF